MNPSEFTTRELYQKFQTKVAATFKSRALFGTKNFSISGGVEVGRLKNHREWEN